MSKALVVEASAATRRLIRIGLSGLGLDVHEADSSRAALVRLAKTTYELVLLDWTAASSSTVELLEIARARSGDVPVLLMAPEATTKFVTEAARLGVHDFILKPFRPEDLLAKAAHLLAQREAPAPSRPMRTADILLIDDVPMLADRLRALLPKLMTVESATDERTALEAAASCTYRLVLVATVVPGVDTAKLLARMRVLQPNAVIRALALRTKCSDARARALGYDGVLFKPFTSARVRQLVDELFPDSLMLQVDDNVLSVSRFDGGPEQFGRYFKRALDLARRALPNLADEGWGVAIVDLEAGPPTSGTTVRFVLQLQEELTKRGMSMKLVGDDTLSKTIGSLEETSGIPVFRSVTTARA